MAGETVFDGGRTAAFCASRFVKEVARFGGDVSSFVPAEVATLLTLKCHKRVVVYCIRAGIITVMN